ncbi:MAG: DUF1778 domain-containing protein [Bacillus sp. (in: Bacteria)]|nr:DUF1778 domain-containing protein [Bacillus sp. (in: firmicutes)]
MKESMITIRITNEEKKLLEQKATENGLTLSQFIRRKIDFYNVDNKDNIEAGICPFVICDIFTEIQKLQLKNPEIDFDALEGSMEKLWQK